MARDNIRPTPSPHEHTVLLGTRHMVRIVKLAIETGTGAAAAYAEGLHLDQRVALLEAIRVTEARLLEKGIPIE
jgi:hypothetical protein